jgi:inorganic pyrophosphatase
VFGHDFSQPILMKSITVIVETPRHTAGKYVFDPDQQCYRLKKILPLGMYFPYDFGMIENTSAEDGDPADAIVMTECVTYPGVRISCRMIGAIQAKQKQKEKTIRNDRYIMISEDSMVFAHIKDIDDFSKKHNEELMEFFINYAKVEDKDLQSIKLVDAVKALKNLEKLIK